MISFPEGTDYHYTGQAKDLIGQNLDLTGATVLARVYHEPREGQAIVQSYTESDNVSVPSGALGYFTVSFDSDDLPAGEYKMEVTATLDGGDIVLIGAEFIKVTALEAL